MGMRRGMSAIVWIGATAGMAISLGVTPRLAEAQGWEQEAKFLAPDGEAHDEFGYSCSVSRDNIMVGALGNDNGEHSGSVYSYRRDRFGVWKHRDKLLPKDGAAGDFFGISVSISGSTTVIGAHRDSDNGEHSGAAYVFIADRFGGWMQQAKLLPADGAAGDQFGVSVSITGDTVVVGAFGDDDNGADSGSAYVIVRENGRWRQQAKLLAPDGAAADQFGDSGPPPLSARWACGSLRAGAGELVGSAVRTIGLIVSADRFTVPLRSSAESASDRNGPMFRRKSVAPPSWRWKRVGPGARGPGIKGISLDLGVSIRYEWRAGNRDVARVIGSRSFGRTAGIAGFRRPEVHKQEME